MEGDAREREGPEDPEPRLVGWAGDEVSGGISTSSTGGVPVGDEADGGLDDIVESAERAGWGQPPDDDRDGRNPKREAP